MAGTRARLAAIGVAGALTATALVSTLSPALAQDANETPSEEAPQTREECRAQRRAEYAAALAAELDLPAEQVQAAMEKVDARFKAEAKERRLAALKARLDAAVAEGRLTQEQADAIYAAAESGEWPFEGPRGRRGHHGRRGGGTEAPAEENAEATAA